MVERDDPAVADLVASFSLCDTWEDRYCYLIELGGQLPQYPQNKRTASYIVKGCVSQVWLCEAEPWVSGEAGATPPAATTTETEETQQAVMNLRADSDAAIVRGMLAIVLGLVNGRACREVQNMNIAAVFERIGLQSHLTSQRANGLRSMIEHVHSLAALRAS